jgi:hypothetical protein
MDVMNQPSASKNASVLWSTRPRLLPKEALAFRPIGYVADRVATEPRIPAPPGPVAEKPCCGAVRSLSFRQIRGAAKDSPQRAQFFQWTATLALVLYRSPPCVCGPDVIEVTYGLDATAHRGWLGCRDGGAGLPSGPVGGRDRIAEGCTVPTAANRSGDWTGRPALRHQSGAGLVTARASLAEQSCQGPGDCSGRDRRALLSA